MTTWLRNSLVIAVFSCFAATAAYAIPFTLTFTATEFVPLYASSPAPDDPVSGTMIFDAASIDSPIDSLNAISLTLSGHTYTLAEVGFLDLGFGIEEIGGLIDGVNGSGNNENDFLIIWDRSSPVPLLFLYATLEATGIYDTSNFTQFNIAAAAVPEPNMLALIVLGCVGMLIARRYRSCAARSGRWRLGSALAATARVSFMQ